MRFCILLRTRVILTGILVCDAQLRSSPPYYVYVTNEASGDMSVIKWLQPFLWASGRVAFTPVWTAEPFT